ncbi:Peptide chain release factor 1 [subsurface metagenome]
MKGDYIYSTLASGTRKKTMFEKIDKMVERHQELQTLLSDPGVIKDQQRYKELMREIAGLEEVVEQYSRYKKLKSEIDGTEQLIEEGGGRGSLSPWPKRSWKPSRSGRRRWSRSSRFCSFPKTRWI